MTYYARTQNDDGQWETVEHHLQRTAALCRTFCGALGDAAAGEWMGIFHDLGKYSQLFQDVLKHRAQHVDHALPGAALLYGKLDPKLDERRQRFLPLALAVRAHHSQLTNADDHELTNWLCDRTDGISPEGLRYAISSIRDLACRTAMQASAQQIQSLSTRPTPIPTAGSSYVGNLEWMLHTRLLFSALTDADYSASAEHFHPDYLTRSAAPPLDVAAACQALEDYRRTLQQKAAGGDPEMAALREDLFAACQRAGSTAGPGVYTLTAPTGAGKTLAMLTFALQQLRQGRRRIIFVLPYISIIEQNARVYRKMIPQLLEDHSQLAFEKGQAADAQAARELAQRWDAPCIVTTSVKFFEGLFANRGPDCRRLHQIAGSVILFDEAQSLPADLANATLRSLQALGSRWGCTVVFSTATQPAFDALPDTDWRPRELVPQPQALFDTARRVESAWQLDPQPLEEIAAQMLRHPNACAIVNLRRHARQLYTELRQCCPPEQVFLLTTDLCPAHRTAVLKKINECLDAGLPCYLAATQCIEAGVDVSFAAMFRALAPLEGIVQAAGRCNRHDTRRRGQLTVFVPQADGSLYPPDGFYQKGATAVRTLLSRHPEGLDLYSLDQIAEYYDILYHMGDVHDAPELTKAIESLDFAAVQQKYRLIDTAGVPVIVPYAGKQELYDKLCAEAAGGVTAGWLKEAAPLTVNCYDTRLVADCCEALHTPARRDMPRVFAGCYLLRDPAQYDSDGGGLQLDAQRDLFV